jgi:hypothetical protein
MEFFITYLGEILGAAAIFLLIIFKNGAKKYVDEKSKNLATIEDTAKITEEVERVRKIHLQQSHAWKEIFEKEYALLKEVWSSTWEMQAKARSLRPLMDRLPADKEKEREVFLSRHAEFVESVDAYREIVLKNRPFIPPGIYEACLSLRSVAHNLQIGFELNIQESIPIKWEKIIKDGKELDEKLENLNDAIRTYLTNKAYSAKPVGIDNI